MTSIHRLSKWSPLALLLTAPLLAQDATLSSQEKGTPKTPDSRQAADETQKALTFARLSVGKSALVINDAGERLGSTREYVIDRKTGLLSFVIVDVPPGAEPTRSIVVPFGSFTWNAKEKRLKLPMTRETLEAMPEFDPLRLQSLGKKPIEKKAAEASAKKLPAGDDVGRGAETMRYLTTSMIQLASVQAEGKTFATATELLFEPKTSQVAFVLAQGTRADADPYVLPFEALTWSAGRDGKSLLSVPLPAAKMVDAPKLTGGDLKAMQRPEFSQRVRRFFQIDAAKQEQPGGGTPKG